MLDIWPSGHGRWVHLDQVLTAVGSKKSSWYTLRRQYVEICARVIN